MKIAFNPVSEEHETFCPAPRPSREFVPEWFKKMPAFQNNKISITDSGLIKGTAKLCQPFTDSLTSGYIQETWCDIYIDYNIEKETLDYKWSSNPQILKIRNESYGSFPNIEGFLPIEFCWSIPWMPELPKGYCALITHPLNRIDLPFYTLSGIIDSDSYKYGIKSNQMPFYIKKDFNGLIPLGTPMFQIIPVKKDKWKAAKNKYNENAQMLENFNVRKRFWGGYKKEHWEKKVYEI